MHSSLYLFLPTLGYVNASFLLIWRRQSEEGEEEVPLDHCSTATLLEMGMAEEPKKTYLLIRVKDDVQPTRVGNVISLYHIHTLY